MNEKCYHVITGHAGTLFETLTMNGSVWGWFLGNFKDQFIILERNLNGHSYINILQHQFLSLMEIIPPKIWNIKFQHDEVPDY